MKMSISLLLSSAPLNSAKTASFRSSTTIPAIELCQGRFLPVLRNDLRYADLKVRWQLA
jgi:hypothetical protein